MSWLLGVFSYACLIWGMGIVWMGFRLWRSCQTVRRLMESLQRFSLSEMVCDDQSICLDLGLKRLPPITVSELVPVPLVLGLRRPMVVLPYSFVKSATQRMLREIVIHESAHIARRDPWVLAAQQIVAMLFWWHPGVLSLNQQIRRAREEVCDNYVLRSSDPADYAQTLLDLAEQCRGHRFAMSLLGLFSTRWSLEDRVSGLLNPRRETLTRTGLGKIVLLTFGLGSLSVFVGGIGLLGPFTAGVLAQQSERTPATLNSKADPAVGPIAAINDAAVSAVEPTLPPSRKQIAIHGRCIDDDSEPVADARVQVFRFSSPLDPPELIASTKSDGDGKFDFDNIETAIDQAPFRGIGDIFVTAAADGHVSTYLGANKLTDASVPSLILPGNPGSLSGTVTDAAGRPIPGVTVFVNCAFEHPFPGIQSAVRRSRSVCHYRSFTLAVRRLENVGFEDRARNGHHSMFVSFAASSYALTMAWNSAVPQIVDVTLRPPAVVEGRVIDAVTNQPAANVLVSAQGVARGGWFQTRADRDGRYRLRMTKDHYNIWAQMDDRMPVAVKALAAVPGQTVPDADIRLVKGGFVVGKIIDATTNEPVTPSADHPLHVAHYGPARPQTGAAVTSTTVNVDGTYRLRVAPGRNYIYVMNGSASKYITVEDGQEVQWDLLWGANRKGGVGFAERDPDRELEQQLRRQAEQEDAEESRRTAPGSKSDSPAQSAQRRRSDTPTGHLLNKLEEQNKGSSRFQDEWCRTLKDIVDLGPSAVPELIAELDATENDLMLRCMGFTLRAIGDKRAVPALIRAIPKTLLPAGSDMGLIAHDPELAKFAQEHDLDPGEKDASGRYDVGRPVRELCAALQKLTGQNFDEEQLYHVFLDGVASQRRMKRELFQRTARTWAAWWEQHWSEQLQDRAYSKVHLREPVIVEGDQGLQVGAHYKTNSGGSNWLLESVLNPKAGRVFYDFDTGRVSGLPEKWRKAENIESRLDEIVAWAAREGFDLMGTEYVSPKNGQRIYALRSIGLRAWELEKDRWKMSSNDITLEALQAEGSPADGLLLHYDRSGDAFAPAATASFLYITREGTPGLLFVGIEVQDDSLKPGGISQGDNELNPIAFHKGRRFAFSHFEELQTVN